MSFPVRECFGDTDITTDARVLFDAVRHGKNHLVKFILEASSGNIVDSRDLHGKTPLMACCYTKEEGARDTTVCLLLSHGADVNLTDDSGRTVLSYVCERRCNDILRILIKERNIDPDIADKNGNTPLIYASMVGNDIACDILIRHFRRLGLSIDHVNNEGFTALLIAAKYGNITCAQILLGQGKASLQHQDTKLGLSVEEWLAKKDISIQNVTPVKNDGKGRTRFIKLTNAAPMCTTKKHIPPSQKYDDFDYTLKNFHVRRIDEHDGDYMSDATKRTNISEPKFVSDHSEFDQDQDFCSLNYKYFAYGMCPKLKTQATQTDLVIATSNDSDTKEIHNAVATLDYLTVQDKDTTTRTSDVKTRGESVLRTSTKEDVLPDGKKTQCFYLEIDHEFQQGSNSKKRLSLPDIEQAAMVSRNDSGYKSHPDMKKSNFIVSEKLNAQTDIGNGRTHVIEPHEESHRNHLYCSQIKCENHDIDCEEINLDDRKVRLPLKIDRGTKSASENETSANEDSPLF